VTLFCPWPQPLAGSWRWHCWWLSRQELGGDSALSFGAGSLCSWCCMEPCFGGALHYQAPLFCCYLPSFFSRHSEVQWWAAFVGPLLLTCTWEGGWWLALSALPCLFSACGILLRSILCWGLTNIDGDGPAAARPIPAYRVPTWKNLQRRHGWRPQIVVGYDPSVGLLHALCAGGILPMPCSCLCCVFLACVYKLFWGRQMYREMMTTINSMTWSVWEHLCVWSRSCASMQWLDIGTWSTGRCCSTIGEQYYAACSDGILLFVPKWPFCSSIRAWWCRLCVTWW